MPRALLRVYNREGLQHLGHGLAGMGWQLIADADTRAELIRAGLRVTDVSVVTGELPLGDRMIGLHPAILAAILAGDDDLGELAQGGIGPLDMVVCNFRPFAELAATPGMRPDEVMAQADTAGITLLRLAAINHARVIPLSDPGDYTRVLAQLRATGTVDVATRRELAAKAFAAARDYDTAIHAYLAGEAGDPLPPSLSLALWRTDVLRYGENPHQAAALYSSVPGAGPLGGKQIAGQTLSYNNVMDLEIAWRTVSSFSEPAAVIVKHQTPVGVATGSNLADAFRLALASDPESAPGGVVAVNRLVDDALVAAIGDLFLECIAAPDYGPLARETLVTQRPRCRLLRIPDVGSPPERVIHSVRGGFLVQTPDLGDPPSAGWNVVTMRRPRLDEDSALRFAWKVAHHVRSNGVVLAVRNATVGISGGLTERMEAIRLALRRAGGRANGAVMAADGFLQGPEEVEPLAEAGVTAIVQPGGALRDAAVIEAADRAGMAMIFTGVRHFRH